MIKNNYESLVKQIYETLLKAKKVSIFPHFNPDNDAYSASLGLAIFLNSLGIETKIVGMETASNPDVIKQINETYNTNDENFIKNSLGVVLDLGTIKNIINLDFFKLCSSTIRIDHHPKTETFCDLEWVDIDYCSTAEMIGWFILFNNKEKLTTAICDALYPGILTDSGNLMFPSASSSIYQLIAIFFSYQFHKQELQNELFLRDWDNVKNNYDVAKHIQIVNEHIAYLIITPALKEKYHLIDNDSKVFLMANVKQFKIWFSVYYSDQQQTWKVSIRSRIYPVCEVAKQFGGGGHKLASGFKIESLDDVEKIIQLSETIIKNN